MVAPSHYRINSARARVCTRAYPRRAEPSAANSGSWRIMQLYLSICLGDHNFNVDTLAGACEQLRVALCGRVSGMHHE